MEFKSKRMMNITEAGLYLGLGRSKTIEFCNQIGAVIHIGRRALYDKEVIDAFFDGNKHLKKE